ncbi:diguanylate cyclase [Halomonas sp. ATCHA]|uniref:Diguanylate cyclase n=2 Tax=Halomonas llamarensis TaxID=2945104 RepID=A0ABT0SPM3_9GAMM|nr:diguanylate cyclase [Halomonas llamarensis]MCL7929754.1 diguanylate cyclase [Halomonas llamarensis]
MAWYLGQSMVQSTSLSNLRYEANMLTDEISQQMNSRISALEKVSETVKGRDNPLWLQNELRRNNALLEWFDGIVVIDANGEVVADWPVVVDWQGLDTAQTEFFRMLKGTQNPYVSEPFIGRASQYPMVLVNVPRFDAQGEFDGVIGGVVSLRTSGLFSRLSRMQQSEGSYAVIFTAAGTVLYHPEREKIMSDALSQFNNRWLSEALDGWQGTAVGSLMNGEAGMQAYGQVWPAGWIVGRYLTREQADLPLSDYIKKLWWIWAMLAVLMLPLLWWLLGRLLHPLRYLETQIGEVGLGQRQKVALATNMQELNQVASTFNRVEGERQALLNSLHEREAFLNSILQATPQGMFVANFDGEITYMNPALLDLLGISSTIPTSQWIKQVHPDDREGALDMWRHSLKTHSDFVRQLRFIRHGTSDQNAGKEILWLEVHARAVMVSQAEFSLGMVGMVKDITERRQQEAIQRWEAEHDPLTGLLNRRGFDRRLDEAFAEFQKTSTPSVLMMFDLDHFKPINDEGGHALGDEMLRRIAQVVAWEVRRSDHVARQGGDEFGVLLPSCTLSQAQKVAESLRQAVADISVTHEGKEYCVTLSMGVTAFSEDDHEVDDAMKRADAASYDAKAQGCNAVVISVLDTSNVNALFD